MLQYLLDYLLYFLGLGICQPGAYNYNGSVLTICFCFISFLFFKENFHVEGAQLTRPLFKRAS